MDKLQAVNKLLKAIGESTVNSLNSGLPDAAEAQAVLESTANDILSKGWHENTDRGIKFIRNLNQEILVPPNVLRIDTAGYDIVIDITVRTDPNDDVRKLFDKKKQTFKLSKDLTCDVIYAFDFEDLSHDLQRYIAAVAAREFQRVTVSSLALDKMLEKQESEAWSSFQDAEAEYEDSNTLVDSPHCRDVVGRNNRYRGH